MSEFSVLEKNKKQQQHNDRLLNSEVENKSVSIGYQ